MKVLVGSQTVTQPAVAGLVGVAKVGSARARRGWRCGPGTPRRWARGGPGGGGGEGGGSPHGEPVGVGGDGGGGRDRVDRGDGGAGGAVVEVVVEHEIAGGKGAGVWSRQILLHLCPCKLLAVGSVISMLHLCVILCLLHGNCRELHGVIHD